MKKDMLEEKEFITKKFKEKYKIRKKAFNFKKTSIRSKI